MEELDNDACTSATEVNVKVMKKNCDEFGSSLRFRIQRVCIQVRLGQIRSAKRVVLSTVCRLIVDHARNG